MKILTHVAVPRRVKPEPDSDNPFDAQAIAFECQIDGVWHIIGCVVRGIR